MSKFKRNTLITIERIGCDKFVVSDLKKKIWYTEEEDFFIYFQSVFFHNDGVIFARYLGETDGEVYRDFSFDLKYHADTSEWRAEDSGRIMETANLAMLENKKGVRVVIAG